MRQDALDLAIADLEKAPKIKIHNKQYSQVATRVEVFRKHFGTEFAILTTIVDLDAERVLMRAEIRDVKGQTIATGHAEEIRAASAINKTSAVENCETSAVGRALAAFGLHGGEYATADEVEAAISQQTNPERDLPKSKVGTMGGPLKKTELKDKMRKFAGDLAAVSDETELVAMLNSYQDVLDQCQRDLPEWWFGDEGDVVGAMDRIEERRKDLKQADTIYDGQAAE